MSTKVTGEKVGEIFAEIRVPLDKADSDFKKFEQRGKQTAEKVEADFKKLRLDFDDRFANMKLSDLKKSYSLLKNQMDQKIKFGASDISIEKTAIAMDAARYKMSLLNNQIKETNSSVGFLERMFVRIAALWGTRQVFNFTFDSIKAAAELKDIQENFEGTARDIELMKKATAGMVDDGDLMKLSNQAAELNVKMKDQPILFLLATNAAQKMGGTVTDGIDKIIRATEGQARGLVKLGIERAKYNQEVDRLAKLEGGKLNDLDAEIQKRVRVQAVLSASGLTMQDVLNRQVTMNEQIKSVPALVQDVKEAWGSLFDPLLKAWLPSTIDFLKDMARRIKELANGRGSNAAENISYDFSGTTDKDRANLINDWQTKAVSTMSKLNKLTADFRSFKIGDKVFEESKVYLDTQLATYSKLIELARKYKEEKNDTERGLSVDKLAEIAKRNSEEAIKIAQEQLRQDTDVIKKREENLAKYYEEVKFKDESYFDWKSDQIMHEIADEKVKNEALKKLVDDRVEYEKDKLTDQSLRGKTVEEVFKSLSGDVHYRDPRQKKDNKEITSRDIFKDFIGESELANRAYDTMFNSISDGFDMIKIKAAEGANDTTRFWVNMGNQVLSMIEQMITKWALFNAISFAGGGGGVNLLSMLGIGKRLQIAGTGITIPTSSLPTSYSTSFSMQNHFNDGNIVGRLDNLTSRVEALTVATIKGKTIVNKNYVDSKLMSITVTKEQDSFGRNNQQISKG
jgi:hypothetical protein